MSKTDTADHLNLDKLAMMNLDDACKVIQDSMGVTDGGFAGQFFSAFEWAEMPTYERAKLLVEYVKAEREFNARSEWSGSLCPIDPDNFWIDDETGERVCATTGARTPPAIKGRR